MAEFFSPGSVEFYIRTRKSQKYLYLGTCVTAPELVTHYYHEPVFSDRTGRVPYQQIKDSEQHVVVGTLNRLNWETLNQIRFGSATPTTVEVKVGPLINHVTDFELYLRNSLVDSVPGLLPVGAWRGRLYYSALLTELHELSELDRTKQITLMFECSPLYFNETKKKLLYTEDLASLPTVTPE